MGWMPRAFIPSPQLLFFPTYQSGNNQGQSEQTQAGRLRDCGLSQGIGAARYREQAECE